MPPIRLKLRDLPRVQDGGAVGGGDVGGGGGVKRSSAAAVGASLGAGAGSAGPLYDYAEWLRWPLVAVATAQSSMKGWFARMDAALLGLPRNLGPTVSSLVRDTERSVCLSVSCLVTGIPFVARTVYNRQVLIEVLVE